MAKVNLSKAAELVGKNRTTIWRHAKQGKISIERGRDGNPLVDTSELIRVYGELQPDATPFSKKKQHEATPSYSELMEAVQTLRKEQIEMKNKLAELVELTNRLGYTPNTKQETTRALAPEEDPDWPVEIKTISDICLRNEIMKKHQ